MRITPRNLQRPGEAEIRPERPARDGFFVARPDLTAVRPESFASLVEDFQRGRLNQKKNKLYEGVEAAKSQFADAIEGLTEEQKANEAAFAKAVASGAIPASANPHQRTHFNKLLGEALTQRYAVAAEVRLNEALRSYASRGSDGSNLAGMVPAVDPQAILQQTYSELFGEAAKVNPDLTRDPHYRSSVAIGVGEVNTKMLGEFAIKQGQLREEMLAVGTEAKVADQIEGLQRASTPEAATKIAEDILSLTEASRGKVPNLRQHVLNGVKMAYNRAIAAAPEGGAQDFIDGMSAILELRVVGTQTFMDDPGFTELMAVAANKARYDRESSGVSNRAAVSKVYAEVDMAKGGLGFDMAMAKNRGELDELYATRFDRVTGELQADRILEIEKLYASKLNGFDTAGGRNSVKTYSDFINLTDSGATQEELTTFINERGAELGDKHLESALAVLGKFDERTKVRVEEATTELTRQLNAAVKQNLTGVPAPYAEEILSGFDGEILELQKAYRADIRKGVPDADAKHEKRMDDFVLNKQKYLSDEAVTYQRESKEITKALAQGRSIDSIRDQYTILGTEAGIGEFRRISTQLTTNHSRSLRIQDELVGIVEGRMMADLRAGGTKYLPYMRASSDFDGTPVIAKTPELTAHAVALVRQHMRMFEDYERTDEGISKRLDMTGTAYERFAVDSVENLLGGNNENAAEITIPGNRTFTAAQTVEYAVDEWMSDPDSFEDPSPSASADPVDNLVEQAKDEQNKQVTADALAWLNAPPKVVQAAKEDPEVAAALKSTLINFDTEAIKWDGRKAVFDAFIKWEYKNYTALRAPWNPPETDGMRPFPESERETKRQQLYALTRTDSGKQVFNRNRTLERVVDRLMIADPLLDSLAATHYYATGLYENGARFEKALRYRINAIGQNLERDLTITPGGRAEALRTAAQATYLDGDALATKHASGGNIIKAHGVVFPDGYRGFRPTRDLVFGSADALKSFRRWDPEKRSRLLGLFNINTDGDINDPNVKAFYETQSALLASRRPL